MTALEDVNWDEYVAAYDGSNMDRVVHKLCADLALSEAVVAPIASAVIRVLHQRQASPRPPAGDAYVAPAVVTRSRAEEASRHAARSAAVSPVVAAAIAQRHLHDDSPLINLFHWDAYRLRIENLHAALPERVFTHALAVKANPMRGVLYEAQRLGCGAECASMAEATHALSLGFAPRHVIYDSPCKTASELREMLRAGVYINVDNEQELSKLQAILTQEYGHWADSDEARATHHLQIGLRINPVVGGGSIDALSTATVTSKFGLPWTEATTEALVALFTQYPWLQGVHVHVGSQGCPMDLLTDGARRAVDFAQLVNKRVGQKQVQVVDIGGGLPTVYDGGEEEAYDFAQYAQALRQRVPELFDGHSFERVITEFGRSVFVKPGITVAKVEAVKNWAGQRTAVVHVGADQFPRTAFLPQLWSHTVSVLNSQGLAKTASHAEDLVQQDVAGPLCFSGDILARGVLLPPIEVGDWLVVHDTGGYTLSMFSKYNSRAIAPFLAYQKLPDQTSHGDDEEGGGRTDGQDSATSMTPAFAFATLRARETVSETLAAWGFNHPAQF